MQDILFRNESGADIKLYTEKEILDLVLEMRSFAN
jgi:hypothetical protein